MKERIWEAMIKDNFFFAPSQLKDAKGRSYYLDNAKFFLIFFVVLAHAVSPLKPHHATMYALWYLLNTFHMPAFIFISGYLAKSFLKKSPVQQVQRPFTYMILYICAQVSVSVFEKWVLHHEFSYSIFAARSSLWFLVCLIFWYLFLPFFGRFRAGAILPMVFFLGLVVGYDASIGNGLSFSRVLVHLPFFLLGYFIDSRIFEFLKKKWVQVLSAFILVGTFVGLFFIARYNEKLLPSKLITCNYAYKTFMSPYPTALWWCSRLIFYVAAIVLLMAFLSLVPRCKLCITRFGSRTLAVYILHRFLYLAYLDYDWANYFDSVGGIFLLILVAFGLTLLFSTKPFNAVFKWQQSIKVDKLLPASLKDKKSS